MQSDIPNEALTLGAVPHETDDFDDIIAFGLSYSGYQRCGSFEKCAEIANARMDGTLSELRSCLYFELRRWHHTGEEPSAEEVSYLRSIISKIRAKVCAQEFA